MRIVFKFWDFENFYYLVDDTLFDNLTNGHYLNDGEPEFEAIVRTRKLNY